MKVALEQVLIEQYRGMPQIVLRDRSQLKEEQQTYKSTTIWRHTDGIHHEKL